MLTGRWAYIDKMPVQAKGINSCIPTTEYHNARNYQVHNYDTFVVYDKFDLVCFRSVMALCKILVGVSVIFAALVAYGLHCIFTFEKQPPVMNDGWWGYGTK